MALIICKECQKEMSSDVKKCPNCGKDKRNWFMRHKIITFIGGFILLGIIGAASSGDNKTQTANSTIQTQAQAQAQAQVQSPAPKEEVKVVSSEVSSKPSNIVKSEQKVPTEYKSALNKANTYANTMHMSKKGVYNQLISEHGEKFSIEAAQYAIDNIKTDWNAHALAKAKTYQNTMSMSPSAIHSQLISEHGEKFTDEEASYAIKHLND